MEMRRAAPGDRIRREGPRKDDRMLRYERIGFLDLTFIAHQV
jgi:hypothetical protein